MYSIYICIGIICPACRTGYYNGNILLETGYGKISLEILNSFVIVSITIYYCNCMNHISGEIVSVLASSAVDRGFEPRSGQTKAYEIDICCFSAKHAAFRRKGNDSLARNQENSCEWRDISLRGPHHHFIEN